MAGLHGVVTAALGLGTQIVGVAEHLGKRNSGCDLNSRRGQIQGMEARPGAQQIDALVPLSEMFGYATDLRSRTQGRGQYSMEPHSYVEIPKSITDKIVEKRNGAAQ